MPFYNNYKTITKYNKYKTIIIYNDIFNIHLLLYDSIFKNAIKQMMKSC